MFLQKIDYTEYLKSDREDKVLSWIIKDLYLDQDINLLVGKNATGKSRSLATIVNLVYLIKGESSFERNSDWQITFVDKTSGDIYQYAFEILDKKILKETLSKNEMTLIERTTSECRILSLEENDQKMLAHNPPPSKLVINSLRDLVRYPYIEAIQDWAESVHSYTFSGIQEKEVMHSRNRMSFENLGARTSEISDRIKDASFKQLILEDLKKLGYELEDINHKKAKIPLIGDFSIMMILEKGIDFHLPQGSISAGMYRVIHIIAIIESLLQEQKQGTLIIDDIGEGLDFERSTLLTKLLMNKIKDSNIQLIISTNDRFLMNVVDVNYWNILKREGIEVKAYNYHNRKELFDEFNLIGLNNFDLFTDFIEDLD